jgi:hypothetical protein
MQPALIHQDTTCTYPPTATGDGGPLAADASLDQSAPVAAATDAAPPLADSKCWTVTYTPTGPGDWAGVDWQYPGNNWGGSNGLVIPAGATRVTFVAWGDVGTEKVSFNVGYGLGSPDGFGASAPDRYLTTVPTPYSIDITGVTYTCSSVRMGFGWVAGGGTAQTFHIADIRWE